VQILTDFDHFTPHSESNPAPRGILHHACVLRKHATVSTIPNQKTIFYMSVKIFFIKALNYRYKILMRSLWAYRWCSNVHFQRQHRLKVGVAVDHSQIRLLSSFVIVSVCKHRQHGVKSLFTPCRQQTMTFW